MAAKFCNSFLPALALVAGVLAFPASSAIAQSKASYVPVSREPNHHVRFDNGVVRVYELQLAKGQWTLFHEHTADNFFVQMATTSQVIEYSDGRHLAKQLTAGDVAFASTDAGPYVHRVGCDGDVPFHVVDIELLTKGRLDSGAATPKRAESPFKLVLENSRGRAYQMVLKAGESTAAFTRPANTAIFAVSGGRISEWTEGKAPRLWDSQPGDFRWVESSERLTIKNDSPSTVELVEIEML